MCHHGLHFPHRWGNNTLGIKETGTDYITAMHAAKEAIWLQQLIGKMFQPLTHPNDSLWQQLYSPTYWGYFLTDLVNFSLFPYLI